MKIINLTEKEMLEMVEKKERFVGFVFKNKNCFSGLDVEMNTGFDLKNMKEELIAEGSKKIVPTGVKWIAPIGYYLSIVPRSGISLNTPIIIANSPATIEASYRGDIGLILKIDTYIDEFDEYKEIKIREIFPGIYSIFIPQYTRLAQCLIHRTIFAPYEDIPICYTISEYFYNNWDNLAPSIRGSKGYGSTGVK